MNKKWKIIAAGLGLAAGLGIALCVGYRVTMAPTKIGFIEFKDQSLAAFAEAADGERFIRIERVPWGKGAKTDLNRYDVLMVQGMGLRLDPDEKQLILDAVKNNIPVYVCSPTSAEVELTSVPSSQAERIREYYRNGGKENHRRLLKYLRREVDGKRFFAEAAKPPVPSPGECLYHLPDDAVFDTVEAFLDYYRREKLYRENAPRVCLYLSGGSPVSSNRDHVKDIIRGLEARGFNVFPLSAREKLNDFIREIGPDLIVAAAGTGRNTEFFREMNVPVFCPVFAYQPYDEWLKDQRGAVAGLLAWTIVWPETDGRIVPYTLAAQFAGKHGYQVFKVLPRRLENWTHLAEKYVGLRRKDNSEKKVVIIYYKGPGENALSAEGLEVGESLFNVLKKMRDAGYRVDGLPENAGRLLEMVQKFGKVLGPYAKGAIEDFIENGNPELVPAEVYGRWAETAIPADLYAEMCEQHGPPPGEYLTTIREGRKFLAISRLRFGNVVVMPLPMAGAGEDTARIIHGTKQSPPHSYAAVYLWARFGFEADALVHFGTHGSVEFTPWKQNALSDYDWPDILTGSIPHSYIYSINNIGEAVLAKRRSYAVMVSHLTAPFMAGGLYGELDELHRKMVEMEKVEDETLRAAYLKTIRELVAKLNLADDLGLGKTEAPGEEALERLHNYLHEVSAAKVSRGRYVLGRPYSDEDAFETARQMTNDPVARAYAELDVLKGKITAEQLDDRHFFQSNYLHKAEAAIDAILNGHAEPASLIDPEDLKAAGMTAAEAVREAVPRRGGPGRMGRAGRMADAKKASGGSAAAAAVRNLAEHLGNVRKFRDGLQKSAECELDAFLNSLNAGFTMPSPGGDPIVNPRSIPTGRNLYPIDDQAAPTREAWETGRQMAQSLIDITMKKENRYPRKAAFTLWGGEFIRTYGTAIGQIFYLLGVEPVWNSRGIVADVRLIPMERLKRPRIDVVVQTSGQFRDAAASRLYLIDKAVRLAAEAGDDGEYGNYIKDGNIAAEKVMIEKGLSPLQARKFASARIFGGVNGNYGTGITGLVEAGDKWSHEKEIADRYLKNMGTVYTEDSWCEYLPGVFEGALQNTDTVVHPRSSNTTGPLSLDHVYEFMGGINLTIRNVTGRDPDAYFLDLRQPGRAVMKDAREAAMIEARSTILNPRYIREMMEEGPTAAGIFAETVRNMYGWEVMKPDMLEDYLWQEVKSVYVDDSLNLGVKEFFGKKNPYALQEMTAVMLETIRKGYWQADEATTKQIAEFHAGLVREHRPGCSGFVCGNGKLREMVSSLLGDDSKRAYGNALDSVLTAPENKQEVQGMKMKKEELASPPLEEVLRSNREAVAVALAILLLLVAAIVIGKRKKRLS